MSSGPATEPGTAVFAYLSLLVAVMIWGGWIVVTRFAVIEAVDPSVLALFRFVLPALMLSPIWLRRGLFPRGASPVALGLMTLGWGAPFVYWIAEGLKTVPAGLVGPLVPGILPIGAALLGWAIFREPLTTGARIGLVLILVSLSLILGQWAAEADLAALGGAPFLLMGAFGWSVYAVMFRRSGLDAVSATAYVGLYSAPLVGVGFLLADAPFAGLGWGDIAFHAVTQGVLAGFVAVLAYALAIQRIGVVRASAMIALVPVAAALMAAAFLGEALSLLDWVAIGCTSAGVAAANGALGRWSLR